VLVLLLVINLGQLSAITWDNVAYYSLDETTGDVVDATGNGNTGTNNGATRGVTGKIENAFDFEANNAEYVELNSSALNMNLEEFSWNIWVNLDDWENSENQMIAMVLDNSAGSYLNILNDGSGLSTTQRIGAGDSFNQFTKSTTGVSGWHMITLTYSLSGNFTFYWDGSLEETNFSYDYSLTDQFDELHVGKHPAQTQKYINGTIDEFGIWNRALTSSEVSELYNSGYGLAYGEGEVLYITLNSPENASQLSGDVDLNATINPRNVNITNSTLKLWDDSGLVYNKSETYTNQDTEVIFNHTILEGNFSQGDYYWNVESCYENATSGANINCTSADNNFTFEWRAFENDGEDFNNATTEGNVENFQINLSLATGFQLSSATLYYDGTEYLGTQTLISSGEYSINREITIPAVTTNENKTFFWEIVMEDGTSLNTTSHNQTVSNINIDDCSSYSNFLLDLELVDEETQNLINETTQSPYINVDVNIYTVGGTNPIIEYSNNFTDSNTGQVCIDNALANSSYVLDAKIQYSGTDYRTEQYNIQKYPLNSTTLRQNITLYDILIDSSETFIINVKDGSFLPLGNALVDISREYVEEGQFKSVEIPITDSNGRAVASLSPEDTTYTFTISEDGETQAIFSNVVATCQNELTGECELNLNVLSSVESLDDYTSTDNIRYTMDFTYDTRTIDLTFNTIDGTTTQMELEAVVFDRWGNDTACSDSLTSSSGTLECVIPASYSNQTFIANIYKDGVLINYATVSLMPDSTDYFGTDAYVFVIMIIMTIPLMFVSSVVGMVVGGLTGLMFISLLLFRTQGGIFGMAVSGMWLVVAAGIIIFKLTSGGNSR